MFKKKLKSSLMHKNNKLKRSIRNYLHLLLGNPFQSILYDYRKFQTVYFHCM